MTSALKIVNKLLEHEFDPEEIVQASAMEIPEPIVVDEEDVGDEDAYDWITTAKCGDCEGQGHARSRLRAGELARENALKNWKEKHRA